MSQVLTVVLSAIKWSTNFAGPCLFESGLIPEKLTFREDFKCLDYKIGLTNIVERTTRSSSDLSKYAAFV